MLTSSRLAPPRTCSSATSTAAWWSSPSMRRRKRGGTRDVGALADHHEPGVRVDLERLQAAEPGARRRLRQLTRRQAADGGGDAGDVVRRGAAAAAHDVDDPGLGELPQEPRRLVGLLVVAAERVRQAGVRVGRDVAAGQPRQLRDVRAHLLRTQRAVDADDERVGVRHRGEEGLDGLARERAAAAVDDRHRDPQREVRCDLGGSGDGGLGVERVEDRLDQQQVDAALVQRLDLLGVGVVDLLVGHRPVRRVLDVRRQRQRHVERAERAGDVAVPELVRRLPGQLGALQVHVTHERLQTVVTLSDGVGAERVGRRDVGAGLEVLPVDVEDHVGTGQVEQVGVARDVVRVVPERVVAVVGRREADLLEHRAPRTVEHDDPFVELLLQRLHPCCGALPGWIHSVYLQQYRRPWFTSSVAGLAGPLQRLSTET